METITHSPELPGLFLLTDYSENKDFKVYNIEETLEYPVVKVNEEIEYKSTNGVKLDNTFDIKDKVIFLNKDGKLLGIYEKDNEILKVWKNF